MPEDVIERVRKLKASALDDRDAGDFETARATLTRAEGDLWNALQEQRRNLGGEAPITDFEQQVAKQLVHVRGSLGGVWRREAEQLPRRRELHRESARAYSAGYEIERPESGYNLVDSYTLVQRLVARVFLAPASVGDPAPVEGLFIKSELEIASQIVRDQMDNKGRKKDEYAAADLVLVHLLLGRDWRNEMRQFLNLKPGYGLTATRELIESLQSSLAEYPGTPECLKTALGEALTMMPG